MSNKSSGQQPAIRTVVRVLGKILKWGFIVGIITVVGFIVLNARSIHYCAKLDLNAAYRSRLPVTATDAKGEQCILTGEPWLTLKEVPKTFLTALVATEDKRFWERKWGVDVWALCGAMRDWCLRRNRGASTLQMQAARSGFDLPGGQFDHSLKRKVLEMIVASRLSKEFTKEQALEIYVNCANFAGEIGLRAAARKFFNCEPRRLSGPQILWLISTLPKPNARAKEADTAKALERVQTTANKCVLNSGCSHDDIGLHPGKQSLDFKKGHPVRSVPFGLFSEVKRTFDGDAWKKMRQIGGADVALTLDFTLQSELQAVLTSEMKTLAPRLLPSDPNGLKAAVVVLDAETCAVLACIGSRDRDAEYSCATQSNRKPGSTFKALNLAAALESGAEHLDSMVNDAPIPPGSIKGMPVGRPWPRNADGKYLGEITLGEAFARSRNPVFVKLGDKHQSALDAMLRAMNLGGVKPGDPVQFFEGQLVTLVELAAAYAPFANSGVWHKPCMVQSVSAADGSEISSVQTESKRVMSSATADAVYSAMRSVVQNGTAQSLRWLPGGGKTGTTSGCGGCARDLRFMYVERGRSGRRSIVVGVWVGPDTGAIENPAATSHHVLSLAGRLIKIVRESETIAPERDKLTQAWR